jgi:hypothetical protein
MSAISTIVGLVLYDDERVAEERRSDQSAANSILNKTDENDAAVRGHGQFEADRPRLWLR